MAYPAVKTAYGLQPVSLIGGQVFAGSTRMFPINTNSALIANNNIFSGDLVRVAPDGTLAAANLTTATGAGLVVPATSAAAQPATVAGLKGVFAGSEYTVTGGPLFGKMRNSYWSTAFNSAQDAVGYVADDPDAVFKVAVLAQPAGTNTQTGATTTIGYMSPAFVGSNVYYVPGPGGSFTTGNSSAGVSGSQPTAGTAGNLRIASATSTAMHVVGVVPESAVTVSTAISATSTTTVLNVPSAAGIQPGMQVIVAGVTVIGSPSANTVVTSVSGNAVTIGTALATAPAIGTSVTFTGYPEVLVKMNFGYHTYYNALGA